MPSPASVAANVCVRRRRRDPSSSRLSAVSLFRDRFGEGSEFKRAIHVHPKASTKPGPITPSKEQQRAGFGISFTRGSRGRLKGARFRRSVTTPQNMAAARVCCDGFSRGALRCALTSASAPCRIVVLCEWAVAFDTVQTPCRWQDKRHMPPAVVS